MPTYEYRCKDCLHELEAQQAFSDDPLTECPSCGGLLKKKFSSVGISFKGSGFYKTDSRSSAGKSTSNGKDGKDGTDSKDASGSSESSGTSGSSTSSTDPSSTSGASPAPTTTKDTKKSPASTPA
jgi:putative FmdB family regulatory protein